MSALENIDYRIFPLRHKEKENYSPFSENIIKNDVVHINKTPCGLIRNYFLNPKAIPYGRGYEILIEPYFNIWKSQFLPLSDSRVFNIYYYVYEASSSKYFYSECTKEMILGFHTEVVTYAKKLPIYQTFYRGCCPVENFENVGDVVCESNKPLSLTLIPDVAISHANRNCMDGMNRKSKSVIYVLRTNSIYLKGYAVNHNGVDLSQVVQSMEHEYEVLLSPPYKLKITSKEVFNDYELLFINIYDIGTC